MGTRSRIMIALILLSGLLVLPASEAGAQGGFSSIVPNHLADVEGNFDNDIPWSDNAPVRYQQVYLGSEVGNIEIDQIRYRMDGPFLFPFVGVVNGVVVMLSSTSRAPDDLSMTFSENLGADATVVYSGDLALSAENYATDPHGFNIFVPLSQTFVFDADAGLNLLVDISITSGPELSTFDAEVDNADSISRVYCWFEPECLGTDQAMISDTAGLVTRFLDVIFFGGFESGDTSAWSVVID